MLIVTESPNLVSVIESLSCADSQISPPESSPAVAGDHKCGDGDSVSAAFVDFIDRLGDDLGVQATRVVVQPLFVPYD